MYIPLSQPRRCLSNACSRHTHISRIYLCVYIYIYISYHLPCVRSLSGARMNMHVRIDPHVSPPYVFICIADRACKQFTQCMCVCMWIRRRVSAYVYRARTSKIHHGERSVFQFDFLIESDRPNFAACPLRRLTLIIAVKCSFRL